MSISFGRGLLCLLALESRQWEVQGGTSALQHGEACDIPHWLCPSSTGDTPITSEPVGAHLQVGKQGLDTELSGAQESAFLWECKRYVGGEEPPACSGPPSSAGMRGLSYSKPNRKA